MPIEPVLVTLEDIKFKMHEENDFLLDMFRGCQDGSLSLVDALKKWNMKLSDADLQSLKDALLPSVSQIENVVEGLAAGSTLPAHCGCICD